MVGYKTIEQAIVQRLIDHFPAHLSTTRCKAADIDALYLAVKDEDADYACIVDFGDGQRRQRPPFREEMWTWQIVGFFLVRYRGDATTQDTRAREIIDRLVSLFDDDPRMGGLSPLVRIEQIGQPEAEVLNEMPFYWISFTISAVDK